jgi:hypothetical protein
MMVAGPKVVAPRHCFCDIPPRDLRRWARRRFVEGRETLELLRMATRPRDRAAVCVVAMLDLPDDEVVRLLGPRTQPGCQTRPRPAVAGSHAEDGELMDATGG